MLHVVFSAALVLAAASPLRIQIVFDTMWLVSLVACLVLIPGRWRYVVLAGAVIVGSQSSYRLANIADCLLGGRCV